MGTEDKRREFDDIVARLITDYPSLARVSGTGWSRPALISVLVAGALIWGLLSVLMVAWGWRGVVLTGVVVAVVAAGAAARAYRRRHH